MSFMPHPPGVLIAGIPIRTREELDALPCFAIIADHSNQVYQKEPSVNAKAIAWFAPGDDRAYSAAVIELPARLLDDGLL